MAVNNPGQASERAKARQAGSPAGPVLAHPPARSLRPSTDLVGL